jgi:hypothetical protein
VEAAIATVIELTVIVYSYAYPRKVRDQFASIRLKGIRSGRLFEPTCRYRSPAMMYRYRRRRSAASSDARDIDPAECETTGQLNLI